MIYRLSDGTRVRVTRNDTPAPDAQDTLTFEEFKYDGPDHTKNVRRTYELSDKAAADEMNRLAVADGVRFAREFGMSGDQFRKAVGGE